MIALPPKPAEGLVAELVGWALVEASEGVDELVDAVADVVVVEATVVAVRLEI